MRNTAMPNAPEALIGRYNSLFRTSSTLGGLHSTLAHGTKGALPHNNEHDTVSSSTTPPPFSPRLTYIAHFHFTLQSGGPSRHCITLGGRRVLQLPRQLLNVCIRRL